jgi:glycosyltransferase involved in cell wall biosynthesis
VHRYPPFPGGSEYYVRDMAQAALAAGHKASVLTGQHQGNQHGVHVTSDGNILAKPFDLIIVHGADVVIQDFVLKNAAKIPSPILYLLILPSETPTALQAMRDARWIGCSTPADWAHAEKHNAAHKAVEVRHGIDAPACLGNEGFRTAHGIKTPYMFLSCGGYWPHKQMRELVEVFNQTGRSDTTLVLTGYDNRSHAMPEISQFVKPLLIDDKQTVMDAMREADLLILHSSAEGFGLVLLEAMLNETPWAARDIAGAHMMASFGFTYTNDDQLLNYMKSFMREPLTVKKAYAYVQTQHLIQHTLSDILKTLG